MNRVTVKTAMGVFGIGEQGGSVVWVGLPGEPCAAEGDETPVLREAARQLLEYCAGARAVFELPLAPRGTPFQMKVWHALQSIPYGQTRTYGDIARAVQSPGAARAVGMACHKNPIPIFIPCHRVVGAGGALTGFGGGLPLKKLLLSLERAHGVQNG